MRRNTDISDFLMPLVDKPFQAYLTNALQVADILEWILDQIGRSKIYVTSFSISEEFLRRLYFIKEKGNVSEINLVLDFKATQKTIKLWAFIQQVINATYLTDNHSKMLLAKSESGKYVSLITSQNLTRGNRNESAFISTDKSIFLTLQSQITELIISHSIPLDELLRTTITTD